MSQPPWSKELSSSKQHSIMANYVYLWVNTRAMSSKELSSSKQHSIMANYVYLWVNTRAMSMSDRRLVILRYTRISVWNSFVFA